MYYEFTCNGCSLGPVILKMGSVSLVSSNPPSFFARYIPRFRVVCQKGLVSTMYQEIN